MLFPACLARWQTLHYQPKRNRCRGIGQGSSSSPASNPGWTALVAKNPKGAVAMPCVQAGGARQLLPEGIVAAGAQKATSSFWQSQTCSLCVGMLYSHRNTLATACGVHSDRTHISHSSRSLPQHSKSAVTARLTCQHTQHTRSSPITNTHTHPHHPRLVPPTHSVVQR